MKREATQTREQLNKEIGEGKSIPAMDEEDTEITSTEEYSSKTEKPFVVSKNEKPMKQEDIDKIEDASTPIDPNEPQLPMSAASRNDPKKIPNNLADFIRQKEETKMKDPKYQQETDDYLINRSTLKQQKRIDEIELTPSKYKEKYGFSLEQKRRETEREREDANKTPSESSNLGMKLRNKRGYIAQDYEYYYQKEITPVKTYIEERQKANDIQAEKDAMLNEYHNQRDPFEI